MIIHKLDKRYVRRDGKPLQVARPTNAVLAVEIGLRCHETQTPLPDFEEMERRCGPYTLVCYMSTLKDEAGNPFVLDADGNKVGKLEPGDSFVTDLEEVS